MQSGRMPLPRSDALASLRLAEVLNKIQLNPIAGTSYPVCVPTQIWAFTQEKKPCKSPVHQCHNYDGFELPFEMVR